MYHYRNKKTGTVIKTHNVITGENWDLSEDTDFQMANDETFEEETFEDETEQTAVAEEAPAEKPKASRRGKK